MEIILIVEIMKYPDGREPPVHGEFSHVGSFIRTRLYKLKVKIISERVKKLNH